jgi:hypothetical protein
LHFLSDDQVSDTPDERPEFGPRMGKRIQCLAPSQILGAGSRNTNIGFTIYHSRPQKRQSPLKVIWEMIFIAFMDETNNPNKWIARLPGFTFPATTSIPAHPFQSSILRPAVESVRMSCLGAAACELRHESSPSYDLRILIRRRKALRSGLFSANLARKESVQP